jgi:hypothetical protein
MWVISFIVLRNTNINYCAGLFVIIGASAALSPTPGMIGYGSSKAAAHVRKGVILQSFYSTATLMIDSIPS